MNRNAAIIFLFYYFITSKDVNKIQCEKKKLTRIRLTKVYQNGVEMFQKVVMGYNKAHPISWKKIIQVGHSSQSKTACGEV